MIYVAFINYHTEGMSEPFYVGCDLENALKSIPHPGSGIVIQKWSSEKKIGEIKF